MKIVLDDVGVDAGMIMICDESYYKDYNYKKESDLIKEIKLPNGSYNVNWFIKDTWNGEIFGCGVVEVTSGVIIVSDPCYCIKKESENYVGDVWDKWLHDTDFGMNEPEGCIIIDEMGGDGSYKLELELEKE
jgi:hypothetical protein